MTVSIAIDEYACAPEAAIREVLARIDRSSYLFQIVVDQEGHLLGTVTDGDIRRAMLHGFGLDGVAGDCMQTQPKTGRLGDAAANQEALSGLGSLRAFLPILDSGGVVREILVAADGPGIGSAIVMAGGPGTRLGKRTETTPKPLLPVGGRPILDHILTALETAGVERIVISVHYLPEQIEAFVATRPNGAAIELIREPHRLGTAGALGQLGGNSPREPMLVVNGDVITKVDFAALHDFHHRHAFDGTIAVARYDVDIPFGVIRYGEDGRFEAIEEKPKVSNFVAAGVYYLSPEYLSLVPPGKPMDMPELLNLGKRIGLRTGLFPIHEYWTDVGRSDDLDAADAHHRHAIRAEK